MKNYLIGFLLFFHCFVAHGQKADSVAQNKPAPPPATNRAIAISTDAAQYMFREPNINLEYIWKRYAIGLYIGIVNPNNANAPNILSNGQYKWPGTVYNGEAFKLYFKWYDIKKPKRYWCAQLVCKPEWYNNVNFYDDIHDGYGINYTMDETATVWGIDILRGHELGESNTMHLDFFYGIGFREKIRTYTIISGMNPVYPGNNVPATYTADVGYITPVMGLKFGVNYLIKH